MPGNFTCPHCDKSFPVLPSLVDRRVRCNGCSQAFVLRKDGHAVPAETAVRQSVPDTSPGNAIERKQAEVRDQIEHLTQSWTSEATATLSQSRDGTRARVTNRLEAVRASMRANLAQAAEQALAATPAGQVDKPAPADTAASRIQLEARLSGSGASDSTRRRHLLLGCLSMVVVCIVIIALWPSTPAHVAAFQRDRAASHIAQTSDGINPSVLLADPGQFHFGAPQAIALQDAYDSIAFRIADMEQHGPCFVATEQGDKILGALRQSSSGNLRRSLAAIIANDGIQAIGCDELATVLDSTIADDQTRAVIDIILAGDNPLLARLQASELGNDQIVMAMEGHHAVQLVQQGPVRRSHPLAAWHGLMIRIDGQWKILHIAAGTPDDRSALRRRWAHYQQLHARRPSAAAADDN